MRPRPASWPALRAVVLVATAVVLAACASDSTPAPSELAPEIDGVQAYDDLSRDHTTEDVDYPQSPPVGGDHAEQWVDCTGTVYDEPVRDEEAVHSLEHGAVWVTYDRLAKGDVRALAERVDGQPYSFLSPYPGQSSPVMLTAWALQLGVDDVEDPRIDEFLAAYRQGPQTPEPGATCDAGDMS